MQCRACLKTNCKVTRLDELKIKCFNLITDLCIHMEDSLPQQLCEICARDLEFCVEFREKCISSNYILSNSILASALTSIDGSKIISKIKQEDNLELDEIKYSEINEKEDSTILKIEYNDLENNETLQSEDNFIYEYISDVKTPSIDNNTLQTPVSSHETAREIATKSNRKLAPRAAKKEINMSDKKQPVVAKFYCGLCAEMIEKDKLCDHVKSHESNNHCGICSSQLKDWETMLYHRISHLQKPNIMCHICLKIFQNAVSLEYHYNIKHLDKVKNAAKCRECNRNYLTLRNLWKHMRTMHNNTNKTYECKECSMSFRNTNALHYHKLKHLNRAPKVLNCNKCDYKTKNDSALSLHKLRMHTAEKASCKLCKALFKNESRLERHKCKFSDPTICPVCGIIIEVPKKMKRHLESHSDERKYKCDRCDVAYKTRGALRVHLNKHDGIRAHKCEYCSKTFWSQCTLKKHRRVHTGEKPYVCKVCNKGFSANHNLKVHMRVHGVFNLIKKKGAEDDSTENVQECNKNSPI